MIPDEQALILNRLRSVEGHLGAIISMVETGQKFEKVLHQLHAVQASLRSLGLLLIQCQLKQTAGIISQHPCQEKRNAEIERLVDLYRFTLLLA